MSNYQATIRVEWFEVTFSEFCNGCTKKTVIRVLAPNEQRARLLAAERYRKIRYPL